MRTNITQEEIESYQDNGFLVLRDFLEGDELEKMRSAVTKSVDKMGKSKVTTVDGGIDKDNIQEGEDFYDNVFLQRLNLWRINAFIKDFFTNPKLGKMLCDLAGVDGMRIWHDQTLQKRPWGNPTGWHLDNPYWSFYSFNSLSIWIALDDATIENGCMWYLPRTHKSAKHETNVAISQNVGALITSNPEWTKLEAVPAPMKAGDCGIHNGMTAHGANANMTPGWRRAMTCAFMPDGEVFNGHRNILPKEYFETLKEGDVLNNDDINPLVYERERV
ncbi:MAG: phytanoyl-CoA dioxygenase family protein [Lentisphaeria bacterium]|nr:phytanoyl-CoA dioxygenase family protein [Lentisphaeria bacterium]